MGNFFPTENIFSWVGTGFMKETDYKKTNPSNLSANTRLCQPLWKGRSRHLSNGPVLIGCVPLVQEPTGPQPRRRGGARYLAGGVRLQLGLWGYRAKVSYRYRWRKKFPLGEKKKNGTSSKEKCSYRTPWVLILSAVVPGVLL